MKQMNIIFLIISVTIAHAFSTVEISSIKGEVQVRRGLDEHWSDAQKGMLLEEIDTIQTGEGTVVLKKQDGSTFTMGSLSILDISDLRTITRQEMFLFVMSQKVQKMAPRRQPSTLTAPNISSVHGEKKSTTERVQQAEEIRSWQRELNTVKAMLNQAYYTNSVVKLHKVLGRYTDLDDCGAVNLYLGKSFEQLDEPGQAVDNYQIAMQKAESCESGDAIFEQAQQAIRRLSR